MAIDHSLFYLGARNMLWKLWVSDKTLWAVQLKCIMKLYIDPQSSVQKRLIFFLTIIYCASRENLVCPVLYRAGPMSSLYVQKVSSTHIDILNIIVTVSRFFSPLSPLSFLTVTFRVFDLCLGTHFILMRYCSDKEPQLSSLWDRSLTLLVTFPHVISHCHLLAVIYSLTWKYFWESEQDTKVYKN